ncbi:hypothetical protein RIF29_40062 [Crotalaria pallida]|uniref:Exocyst subunit Exo70 family protein n=1 Tax=Crotalaria pallida TaxID=3830 RepID=A0AAN9E8R0_CROPI
MRDKILISVAKNMRGLCFPSKTPSSSITNHSNRSTPPRLSFSDNIDQSIRTNDENSFSMEAAEALIQKWNYDTSAFAKVTSLFYEDKTEAMQYINYVKELHKFMHSLLIENPSSEKLILAQNLMQIAMKRLRKEFYQILSMNRAHLDPESISVRSSRTSVHSSVSDYDDYVSAADETRTAGDSISEVERLSSIVMEDLKAIAECMVSCGYRKECVSVYSVIRKSIVDEGVYKLGVEKVSSTRLKKMDWEVIELKIQSWLAAVTIAVRTLFNGERILCDHVFGASDSIRESCFAEISRDGAIVLFGFPETVAKPKKLSSPEKMFRVLDMYASITEMLPEIEAIFSSDSTSAVRSQVNSSIQRIIERVQTMLTEFESTIQKDSSKSPVNSGGVHSLTVQSMNYLSNLADYSNVLSYMFSREDFPKPKRSPVPESYLYSPESEHSSTAPPPPPLTARVAWLILVLLCKLDTKAKHCKDVSLSYLFFANNLRYIFTRIKRSNLQFILGYDWITKHEEKVKKFVANYERVAWGEVFSSLPENISAAMSPAEARAVIGNFNFKFEEAYRKQNSFVVADREMRDEIKGSIARNLVPRYRELYNTVLVVVCGGSVREMKEYVTFTPEDVENYIANLFFIRGSSSGVSTSSSVTSSPHRRRS